MYIHTSQRRAQISHTVSTTLSDREHRWADLCRHSLWKVVLAAGALAIAFYYVVPTLAARDAIYLAVGLSATFGILVGLRMHRVHSTGGWYLVAAANGCFVLGDAVLDVYDVVLHVAAPFPSMADLIYLAGYPFLFAGVLRLSPGRNAAWHSGADAAAVCVGTLGLLWHFLMGPTLAAPLDAGDGNGTLGKLVTMAYPVMDIGILWVLVGALLSGAARRSSDRLLVAAVVCMLVSDFTYDLDVLHGTYSSRSAVNAGFLLTYVVFVVAVLHPSAGAVAPREQVPPRQNLRWMALVAVGALISPVIMFISGLTGLPIDLPVLSATSLVVFGLVVLRIYRLMVQVRGQNELLAEGSRSLRRSLDAQRLLEDDLRHRSTHDDLTGLANRWILQERVTQALAVSTTRNPVALCFCDLDDFKAINDSLGHQVGDELLVVVAKRLGSIARGVGTVARLGGDEFAILLENAEQPQAATAMAERIISVLRQPIRLPHNDIRISASVGVAVAGPEATTQLLLSEADAAMYEAKSAGKDRSAVFETIMRSRLLEKTAMVNCFPGALQRSEFVLEYQPQFSLLDGALEGFETLVRWRHPTLGLLGPDKFIPLAEETRFILRLGSWILLAACTEAAGWPAPCGSPLTLAVNLSGWQLQEPGFLDDIREALRSSGLPPTSLVLEITESVLMEDPAGIAEVLGTVRRMGVRVAIDDFGTGFSSLSHLRQLPVDILKIDKSFIDPLSDRHSEGDAFVATIVRLADDLGLSTVAEGIEHRNQLEALRRLGCHSGQGFLVSASLSASAARRFIRAGAGSSLIPVAASDVLVRHS